MPGWYERSYIIETPVSDRPVWRVQCVAACRRCASHERNPAIREKLYAIAALIEEGKDRG
jgi:hypothetical protein